MERVLACLQVQSYNTKKRIPNFLAILWCFEMLKSAHFPSVYWEKIIFLYRESVRIFKVSPWTKVPPLGQVFKIGKRLCKILSFFVVDKGMIKWATPLGVR